jgi:hypothetical protein
LLLLVAQPAAAAEGVWLHCSFICLLLLLLLLLLRLLLLPGVDGGLQLQLLLPRMCHAADGMLALCFEV